MAADREEVLELIKLFDATINHSLPNIKEEALKELLRLDKEAGERLEAAKKKEANEAAKGEKKGDK